MTTTPIFPPEETYRAEALHTNTAARQHTLRKIALIAGREYKSQVTRHSFIVTCIFYLVVIIIGSFVPTIIQYAQEHSNAQSHLVVINNAGLVAGMSEATLMHTISTSLNGQSNSAKPHFALSTRSTTDIQTIQSALKNGADQMLLVIGRDANQRLTFAYYTATGDLTDSDGAQIRAMAGQLSILDGAAQQHLSAAQVSSIFAEPQFSATNLKQNTRDVAAWITGMALAYAGVILLFASIMMYGVGVAHGVAEEKGSRIMEILVLAATPFQLMVGKILGIGAAGLTQFAGLVAVGCGMFALQTPLKAALHLNSSGFSFAVTGTTISMLLLTLLYFVLAFVLYSSLYAAAGALVQRREDAQNAGQPITMLFVIGYITSVSITSIPSIPDAGWFKVMSYIPFWTPTTMLVRMGVGSVAWWEIPLTIVLMLLAFPLCAWISARIYRYGILMYGQRFNMRRLLGIVVSRN